MFFFFFQAEDGIRDKLVTGVQTCALPISCVSSKLTDSRTAGSSSTTKMRPRDIVDSLYCLSVGKRRRAPGSLTSSSTLYSDRQGRHWRCGGSARRASALPPRSQNIEHRGHSP